MSNKVASPDLEIARIARAQHGVISTQQLARAGIGRSAASRRARNGRLHRVHQGVYAVGHQAPSWLGRWMGAVLACGEGAVLSHLSAAHLWRLLEPRKGPIHVSVSGTAGRARRHGIVVHRYPALEAMGLTERRGIPVTTPAKTISDLSGVVSPALQRRTVRQAEVLGLATGLDSGEPTRSELEHLFLRLCERHQLPTPVVNVRVGRYEVDFLWRAERLIVETDGYRYHRGAQAFEDDRTRDLELQTLGYTLRRFSYRQVTDTPQLVAEAVRAGVGSASERFAREESSAPRRQPPNSASTSCE